MLSREICGVHEPMFSVGGTEKNFDFNRTKVLSYIPIELENVQKNFCHPEGAELRKILLFLNKTTTLSIVTFFNNNKCAQ